MMPSSSLLKSANICGGGVNNDDKNYCGACFLMGSLAECNGTKSTIAIKGVHTWMTTNITLIYFI